MLVHEQRNSSKVRHELILNMKRKNEDRHHTNKYLHNNDAKNIVLV